MGFERALQGYSFVGASAVSSLLGKGDDAVGYLHALIARFVKPNTMDLVAPGIGTDAVLAPVAQAPGSPVPFGVR
jgi:hypothetical protein